MEKQDRITNKEGFCIVVGSWLLACVVGMFPCRNEHKERQQQHNNSHVSQYHIDPHDSLRFILFQHGDECLDFFLEFQDFVLTLGFHGKGYPEGQILSEPLFIATIGLTQ